jgi:GTP-binding protein
MFLDQARIELKQATAGAAAWPFDGRSLSLEAGPAEGTAGGVAMCTWSPPCVHNTLIQFRYNRIFHAKRGEHGLGSKCHGKDADDLLIQVPVGTVVYDDETGELVHDFADAQRASPNVPGRPRRARQRTICNLGESGAAALLSTASQGEEAQFAA